VPVPENDGLAHSVFINHDESGLHHDYEVWLEGLAPHAPIDQARRGRVAQPDRRGHRRRAPEAELNYQLRVMGREVVVAVTNGRLDFGPWEQVFYGGLMGAKEAGGGQGCR
jgi:thiamine phosphate synthase YjbQ (UPF0047 family)